MAALALVIVAAPLISGGWPLAALPLHLGLAALAWTLVVLRRWRADRSVSIPLLSLCLGALAAFTALQALPAASALTPWLSPAAAEVQAFVGADRLGLGYEPGAAWREAAKLVVYALVAASAHMVARRRGTRPVLAAVCVTGAASVLAALAHRLLVLDAQWGVLEGARAARTLGTTFPNPNHASAFLGLTAMVAVGLGVDAERRGARWGFLALAAGLAAASVVEPSKGGILSLGVGLLAFGGLWWYRSRRDGQVSLPLVLGALLLPLVGVIWRLDAVVREFGVGERAAALGLVEKMAAVQNAWPIVMEHPWVGIGRGAYISVYPRYQSSELQLTFAFPENIAAQLLSEWGVLVGGAALLGLLLAVALRLARIRRPHEIAAVAGVAATIVHDFVDFSLEIPGVAIPAVAILGAITPGRRSRTSADGSASIRLRFGSGRRWEPIRVDLSRGAGAAALAALPVMAGVVFTIQALRGGDIRADVAWVRAHAERVAGGAPVDEAQLRLRTERHPTNALLAAQLAYLREVQDPPDLRGALAAVNRALFLAPNYADAHLLAGRLLMRAGHRRQALEELRRAWTLSRTRADVLATAVRWGRTPDELEHAVPRVDPALDRLDGVEAARLAFALVSAGRVDAARALLGRLPPVEALDQAELSSVSRVALSAGLPDLALAAARRGAQLRPGDGAVQLTFARLAHRAGRVDEARRIAAAVDPETVDPVELLELRFRLALEAEDRAAASARLEDLRRALPLTRESQTQLALREARLHLADGRPDRAVPVLARAIDWSPSDPTVRMTRAQVFERLGRLGEARVDAEAVLRRDPGHAGAKKLLRRLDVSN